MATSETEPEPGEPPDPTGPEEPDQPGGPRLRMQRVQLIVNALGVTIGLAELLRGCGG